MPETIDPPPAPATETPVAPERAPDTAGRTSLSSLFDRLGAENRGEPPPPEKSEPAIAPAPEPEKDEFVPPAILAGEPTLTAPETSPGVADLMPEAPPTSIRTEKGRSDYKKWREHQLNLETQLKELKGATPEKASDDLIAQNTELKQRLAEMSSVTERVALMDHPAFRQQFIVPREQMLAQAKEAIEMVDGSFGDFEKMLTLSGKAKVQAIDDLMDNIGSPTLKGKLERLVDSIENLDRQREQVMADVKGNSERLEMQTRAQRQQQMETQQKEIAAQLDATINHLRDHAGFEFFKEVPGNEKWNGQVKAARENALYILTQATPQEAIASAAAGSTAPLYRTAYHAQVAMTKTEKARADKAEAEIAELKGAVPRIADGGGALDDTAAPNPISAIFKRVSTGGLFGT